MLSLETHGAFWLALPVMCGVFSVSTIQAVEDACEVHRGFESAEQEPSELVSITKSGPSEIITVSWSPCLTGNLLLIAFVGC